MTRACYRFILWMHPPAFRRRFQDEMLSIFDEASRQSGFALLLDGFISFARQWLLRTDAWKLLIAVGGTCLQLWGFALRTNGQQSWKDNHQTLTPYMQELMFMTIAVLCGLCVTIMSLALWTIRFQRRRSEVRRTHVAALATARSHTRQ